MINSNSGSRRFAAPRALGKFLSGTAAATFLIASVARAAWALPIIPLQVSTNPGNGDQNPYGVVFVPPTFPDNTVQLGDVLVANFNDAANNQGQGTTIINVRPDRTKALFAKGLTPGLTGAMSILRAGFVLIGSITVPKPSNFPGAVGGPITVLDYNGKVVTTITSPLLDGPWGMALDDDGATAKVFVSNVLNGTVIRLNLTLSPAFHVDSITRIAQGYGHINNNTNPLVGPSGLAYNEAFHTLYVTSAGGSRVFKIAKADTITVPGSVGTLVYADALHLHGPLGLAIAPNGDLISAQADNFNVNPKFPSEIVEFTTTGQFVAQFSIDAANGAAFNIALAVNSDPLVPIKFAYLNDGENTVNLIYLPTWGLW
jgi:hypothetical protein